MQRVRGFTLIETLLAVVLLAVVVGVCTPYLQGDPVLASEPSQSAFFTSADQLIEQWHSAHGAEMTYADYAQLAMARGWLCQRVALLREDDSEDQPLGEWVQVSDGVWTTLRWAVIDQKEGEGTP